MKKYLLKLLLVLATLVVVTLPVALLAQEPIIPTPDSLNQNPFVEAPIDGVGVLTVIWSSFRAAWFIGVSFVLYLLMNVIRGKLRIGAWVVKIPWLSDWFEGVGKKWKAILIVVLTGLASAFAALVLVKEWTFLPVAKAMGSGLVAGVYTALAALGVNNVFALFGSKKPDAPTSANTPAAPQS